MKKNISVIGCGYWGKNLIRNFYELEALNSICDIDIDLAAKFSNEYNVPCKTFNDILNDTSIEGVVIALPVQHHFKYASKALEKNKKVFVEKPLTANIDEAKKLIEIQKNNSRIMVGHLLRYHPSFIKVNEILDSDVIGKPQFIYSNRKSLGIIRNFENVSSSFAVHDIAMILSIFKKMPVSVYCNSISILQKDIEDISEISMFFSDFEKATIGVSWISPYKEHKLTVMGKSGAIVFDDTKDKDKLKLNKYNVDKDNNKILISKNEELIEFEDIEPLKAECMHFLDVVNNDDIKPLTNANEGLNVLKILEGCRISLEKNKTVLMEDV